MKGDTAARNDPKMGVDTPPLHTEKTDFPPPPTHKTTHVHHKKKVHHERAQHAGGALDGMPGHKTDEHGVSSPAHKRGGNP
jgi:hypothetical protein